MAVSRLEQRMLWDHLQKTPRLIDRQIARRRAQTAYWRRNQECIRATRQVARYGLTFDQHSALLDRQGERCAICREAKLLVVDHDRITARVRGLLCHKCNLNLGKLESDWAKKNGDRAFSYAGIKWQSR